MFGTPDEIQTTSFRGDFSNETIKKHVVRIFFFPLSSSNNVYSDGILPLTRMNNRFGEVTWCVRVSEDGEARFG